LVLKPYFFQPEVTTSSHKPLLNRLAEERVLPSQQSFFTVTEEEKPALCWAYYFNQSKFWKR